MKRALQIVLAIFSLIPLGFAIAGLWAGAGGYAPGSEIPAALDNQFRYLSGIYALVSILIWWAIPDIERRGRLLGFICLALVLGGLGRVVSWISVGPGSPAQMIGMMIELGSPLLLAWQRQVARACRLKLQTAA